MENYNSNPSMSRSKEYFPNYFHYTISHLTTYFTSKYNRREVKFCLGNKSLLIMFTYNPLSRKH